MIDAVTPIKPELLASKIEKLENFELPELLDECAKNPRFIGLLWFLQWVSQPRNYAGGLARFSADLVGANEAKVGTRLMLNQGSAKAYSLSDAVAIFRELPGRVRESLFGINTSLFEEAFLYGQHEDQPRDSFTESRKDWHGQFLAKVNPAVLRPMLCAIAREELGTYFKALCETATAGLLPTKEGLGAPWYFVSIAECLLDFVDLRAARLRKQTAETAITKEIRRWIGKARNMQKAVLFTGNSRFGKTEAVRLEANADPGSCRLVNTPASNAISDLLREVAKSLGIDVGPSNAGRELRERIDYVLRFSRLQLIFDESQFLLPANYTRNTAPARLNWVRRSVMDQGFSAVFVCTPQSYLPAKRRFVNTTGFAMEQFDERIIKRELPSELSEEDLVAVARIHFEDLPEDYLRYVVEMALATERNFVSDIEKIATLAKDNSREHGRERPILADIESAIADVLPTPTAAAAPRVSGTREKQPVQVRCKPNAHALPSPRKGLEISDRSRLSSAVEVPV